MKDFIKNIIDKVKQLDTNVNDYKNKVKDISLPSYAFNNWAIELMKDEQDEEALKKLETNVNMGCKNPQTFVNLGLYKLKQQDFDSAAEYFKKALRIDNECAKAYAFLGSCYLEKNDFEKCKKMFQKSLKIERRNSQTYLNYAIALVRMNDKENANMAFQRAFAYNSSDYEILFLWGIFLAENNDFKNAIKKLTVLHNAMPFHEGATYFLAYCNYHLGNIETAINYAKKLISINKEKIEGYIILAESYLKLNNEEKCFETYENAIKNCPDTEKSFRFYHSMGVSNQHFDKWKNAIKYFEKASEIEKENYLAPYNLSLSYLKLQEKDKAKILMEETLKLNPTHSITLYNLGQYHIEQQEYEKAIEYFKKAIKTNKNCEHFNFNIAFCYQLNKDYKNAIKYYEKTLEYDKDNIEALVNLANVYSLLEDNKQAIRKIRTAYTKHKDKSDIVLIYAVLLLKDNQLYDAMDKFIEAFNLNHNLAIAVFGRCECLVKLNKPKEALGILNNYENTHSSAKDFLMVKLLAYLKLQEEEKTEYYKNIAIDICDKITSLFGEDEWINNTKKKLGEKDN